jgi:hypothetical protein
MCAAVVPGEHPFLFFSLPELNNDAKKKQRV